MELTILMPCLDEAETLATCIGKANQFLASRGIEGEVVIADNGSTDGSQDIARQLGARVIDVPVRGYGAALIAGIEGARGRYVIMGDSDDSYDFSSLDPFVESLRGGADLVMGDRFAGGIRPGAMKPLHKYLGNPVLSFIGRLLFRSDIRDFHCGLRGFDRQRSLELGLQSPGMEFASEMVVKATLAGQRIDQVPTVLHPDGRSRPPHLRSWSDGWRHLRFLLLFSPRWLFFYPGLVAFLLGGSAVLALSTGPIEVGDVTFDVSTAIVASGVTVLGYLAVWFAVLVKAFASREGLLPHDVRVERFRSRFPLEKALLLAVAATLLGLVGLVVAVLRWDFEPQDPSEALRLVVPSTTVLVLGAQTALASLLLSVLALPSARPAHGGANGAGVATERAGVAGATG
ncbi:MAG TPA: glycosyltransferase family 2 protein [Acidimicrobiales bacterium]|nr:glycosyltransferase family 2 protein [Acidimicrobiales bacterium]